MPKVRFWTIAIQAPSLGGLEVSEYHEETGLSPHVRVSTFAKAAYLDSESLACEYLDACTLVLDRRYGAGNWSGSVRSCVSSEKWVPKKIREDSAVVRARLRTGNLAPNRKVEPQEEDYH